jgi:CHAT domain-containing protein
VSLWQVRDDITSLFMARFYELLELTSRNSQQRSVSGSLRQARTWLRGLSNQQAEAFKQMHPRLSQPSDSLDKSGPITPNTPPGMTSYSSPEYWAAFIAWGY